MVRAAVWAHHTRALRRQLLLGLLLGWCAVLGCAGVLALARA
ncbi:hypothetical protein [Streptomyces pactum]|nr:hypothetical protein [Streptomyces pactum]